MNRSDATKIKKSIEDILDDIDEFDPDETEFWVEMYWALKDIIDRIEEYYG
jgi:hypothetical protein